MIWLGVQPLELTVDICGGKFANWVMSTGESVPVGVEIKSIVGVLRKKSDGSPGIMKVAIKISTQNKIVINIEIPADCPNRRDENSRSIRYTATLVSRHERHSQRKENMPPIAKRKYINTSYEARNL